MANQITANPSTFMSALQKAPASSVPKIPGQNKAGVLPTLNAGASLGVLAKSPEQNIQKPSNTLPSGQAKAPVSSFTLQQDTELNRAYTRNQSGQAMPASGTNAGDVANVDYATKKGWKPSVGSTTAPTSPSNADGSTTGTTPPKPVDTSSKGILGNLVEAGKAGTQTSQAAQTGLLGTAQNNMGTSGQAYQDYQTAIDELNALKSKMATTTSLNEQNPIALEFQGGRQDIMNRQYASQLEAAQQKVNQAQAAIGYQLQGTATQQSGLSSAGGLGTSAQGLLGTAAEYAQPVQVPYSNQYINPQTGESVGGAMGGSMQSAVQNIAEKVKNGTMGYDAGVSALVAYGQAGVNQLQQMLGPNFNIQQSNAQAQAQGASTLQTGTTGGILTKSADSANQALAKLETDFNRLSSLQTGGVPATNSIANWIAEKFGQGELSAYQTTLSDARAQLGGVLSAAGAVPPTGAMAMALTYLPDNMTPTMFKEKLDAAKALISQKVQAFTNQNSTQGANQNQGTTGITSSGIKYTITEK